MNHPHYYSAIAEYKNFLKLGRKEQANIKENIIFELVYSCSVLLIFITACYIFQVLA